MPGLDRTGPYGRGPATGGGFGQCLPGDRPRHWGRGGRHRRGYRLFASVGNEPLDHEIESTKAYLKELERHKAEMEKKEDN